MRAVEGEFVAEVSPADRDVLGSSLDRGRVGIEEESVDMLPLVRPAMVIAAIQNVVPIWNDFFFPLIFIQNNNLKTLPQGLTAFMGEFGTDWGVLFSGLTLSALPIIILYIALSRQFINGMTAGAIK